MMHPGLVILLMVVSFILGAYAGLTAGCFKTVLELARIYAASAKSSDAGGPGQLKGGDERPQ
jgi:hypothetical protein